MYTDIDGALQLLSEDSVPLQLAAMDELVLSRVKGHSFSRHPALGGGSVMAVGAALLLGIAAGLLPGEGAEARRSLSPLVAEAEFAPSSLLT